jgi:hypothetical protein
LRRSGTISKSRYEIAIADQAEWGGSASTLCQRSSSGAASALAVTVFTALDAEIRAATSGDASLDNLVAELANSKTQVGVGTLHEIAERLIGKKPDALHIDNLPGCRTIQTSNTDKLGS